MKAVFELFWNLCLLRVGPERMPTVGLFVATVVIVDLAISALVALSSPFASDPLVAISTPVIAAAVLASGTWLVLQIKGVPERFTATFTALMGADAIITAFGWPVVLLMQPGGSGGGLQAMLVLAQFALLFWWITVSGFVFARALAVSRAQGVAIAVFVVMATLLVSAAAFPPPGVVSSSTGT